MNYVGERTLVFLQNKRIPLPVAETKIFTVLIIPEAMQWHFFFVQYFIFLCVSID